MAISELLHASLSMKWYLFRCFALALALALDLPLALALAIGLNTNPKHSAWGWLPVYTDNADCSVLHLQDNHIASKVRSMKCVCSNKPIPQRILPVYATVSSTPIVMTFSR